MSSSSLSTVCGDEEVLETKSKRSLLCQSIAKLLEEAVAESSSSGSKSLLKLVIWPRSLFYSKRLKKYDLEEYLDKLSRMTELEESSLIHALVLVDRLCEKGGLSLIEDNVHK